MAALPPERTTLSRPFTNTGIDFAGPFDIKTYAGRGCKVTKGYVLVFVCFATKAIHLEATIEISTQAFLAAFARFFAWRGSPSAIYSDNGTTLLSPPEPNLSDHSLSYLNRWQKLKILHHHFSKRWKEEYLKELNKRMKWKYPQRDYAIGDLVIIRHENLPPNQWRLGRIEKVFRGTDNRVRVAEIRTANGIVTRPIVKLVLLPNPEQH